MRRMMLVATAAALLLSACGADTRTGASAAPDSTATGATATGATAPSGTVTDDAVPEALRFSAPAVGGGTLDMSTYAGRTVAFWFWAPT